jgi:hypothetical protein
LVHWCLEGKAITCTPTFKDAMVNFVNC